MTGQPCLDAQALEVGGGHGLGLRRRRHVLAEEVDGARRGPPAGQHPRAHGQARPGPRTAIIRHASRSRSTCTRSLNRSRRSSRAWPQPASVSSTKVRSFTRWMRHSTSTLPGGCSTNDHADAPASIGHVLAALALQVGLGVGAAHGHDVAGHLTPHRRHAIVPSPLAAAFARTRSCAAPPAPRPAAPPPCCGTRGPRRRDRCRPRCPAPACSARALRADEHGADGDGGVEVAGEVDVADDAGVGPALDRLELVDDLHGPHLRRAAHRARRQRGPQHVDGPEAGDAARPTPAT